MHRHLIPLLSAGAVALVPKSALAHPASPLARSDLWSAWSWEPAVVVLLVASGALYIAGVGRLWSKGVGTGIRVWEASAFGAGWLAAALALVSPLHALSGSLFSAHMAQHEVLIALSAPLLVLGRPVIPFLWAMPPHWRSGIGRATRTSVMSAVWSVLTPARVDLALAVLAGAYALLVVASTIGSATAAGPSTGAASTSAVGYAAAAVGAMAALAAAGVRRRPFTATMVAMALVVGYAALIRPADAFEGWVAALDLIVFPFLVGAALGLGAAAAGLAACVITAGLTVLASRASLSLADLATLGISAGAWMAGRVLRGGARALDAEARLSAAELATQQAVLLAALHADRADVARDLHDAVGHVMTGIVLQASAAIRVWDTPRADAHIVDLRHSLAEALDELRPLLGRLAVDPDPSAEIGGIDALIQRARRTGLPVVVHGSLPPSEVDAVVYRVVQESLTNAARHAPGTAVTLRFATDEESIVVEVANAVPSAVLAGLAQAGSGQGLRGMAERVSARGGDLHAAPTAEGGFVVRARVPRARVVA